MNTTTLMIAFRDIHWTPNSLLIVVSLIIRKHYLMFLPDPDLYTIHFFLS